VTGGAGFIGSRYARSVLGEAWGAARPDPVAVLDTLTTRATGGIWTRSWPMNGCGS